MPYTNHTSEALRIDAPIRVLIADNNAKRRAAARRLVTSAPPAPTTVLESRNFADALRAAGGDLVGAPSEDVRPDVVMLHLDLLPANGNESGWLDALEPLSGLPVVLIGEDENDPRAEIGLAAGAQDYIVLGHLTAPGLRRTLVNAQTRHRLLQSVAASDAHFRTLADAAPVLIWVADTTQGCVYFNRVWLDFTGRTMEQEVGFGWTEGVHRDDHDRVIQVYRDAFADRQPFELELRLRRHDGMDRWVLNRGVPRFSPDGTFMGYSGSCIDFTERRLAEDELRASEGRLRELAALLPQIIWVADVNGQAEYMNEQWTKYTGLTPEQSLGNRTMRAIHPDDARQVYEKWEAARKAGVPYEAELRLRAANGSYAWFLARSIPVRNAAGAIIKWFGTSTDIDARKRAQIVDATLARMVERLRQLSDPTHVAEALVTDLAQTLQVDLCVYSEIDWGAGQATIHARYEHGSLRSERILPLAEVIWPITAAEIAARRAVAIHDLATDARTRSAFAAGRVPSGLRSAVVVPSKSGDRGVGLLMVGMHSPRTWTSDEIELLERLAVPARLTLEKAKAEQAILARETILQLALSTGNMGTFDVDYATLEVEHSPSLDHIFGLAVTTGKRPVADYLALVHPKDIERLEDGLLVHPQADGNVQAECRILYPDGEVRWLSGRGRVVYAEDGRAVRLVGALVDITERRRTEEALLESEARFRLALGGSPITVYSTDRDLRYTWVYNPAPGLSAEAMLGLRDDELLPPDEAQQLMALKQEVLDKGVVLRREMDLTFGQDYARYDITAERIHDEQGEVVGVLVVAMDITERTRAEARLAFLADASKTLSGSLIYEETLQKVASTVVPRMADWCAIDLLTPDRRIELAAVAHVDPAKVAWAHELRRRNPPSMEDPAGLANVIRTGQPEFYPKIDLQELIEQATDEETRQVLRQVAFKSAIVAPLNARDQTLGAMTLVWSDSDRYYDGADLSFAEELARRAAVAIDNARLYHEAHTVEAELRVVNESLEQRVAERTAELIRSNQELDQFAYIASHDLKAPLRAIDHLATWLDEDTGQLLPERSRTHLVKMRGRIQRMEGLLDDLLAYSRAGRHKGEATEVSTRELVERVIETVAVPESFEVTLGAKMPMITTLHVPLETVLRNLMSNAVKHHDKPNGHVHVDARRVDKGMIEFVLRDDGPGIDPVYHERIFQMFQTLQPRDQLEGSGIGLAVVKKIVDSMGGNVWVESQLGQGASFHFTWPDKIG